MSIITEATQTVNAETNNKLVEIAEAALANTVTVNVEEAIDLHQLAVDVAMSMPEDAQRFTPKMAFHMVDGYVRRPFNKADGVEYDVSKHFLPHEVRQFPERKMPCEYGIASYSDLKQALAYMADGVDFNGKHWVAASIGWVKSGEGCTIMFIPADVKLDRNRLHEAMGLHANLKKTADEGKFNKYLKRMCAMYRHASWGTESSLKDDMMIYRSEGARWRVRWNSQPMQDNKIPMPEDFKIEGMGVATPEWATAQLGPNPDRFDGSWKVGDAVRITLSCSKYMFKGHMLLWNMKNVDVSLWDCKFQLSTDEVFVGFMGCLHAGDLRFNIQPIVNFGLHKWAEKFGVLAMEGFQDEMANRDLLMKRISMQFAEQINDDDCESLNNWRLMSAIKAGFDPEHEPFMMRDIYRAYLKKNIEIENGRVPVPEQYGIRAYYFIDPWCIGSDGIFRANQGRLRGNTVHCSRLNPGEWVITYRDPQTPPEWQKVQNVGSVSTLGSLCDNVIIISAGIAMAFAAAQGGGDYDDCGNILRGPLVDHWDVRPIYPAKDKAMAKAKAIVARFVESNRFALRKGLNKPVWNTRKLEEMITAAANADAGMGMIVNWLMVRISMSFYRDQMVTDLEAQYMMYELGLKDRERHVYSEAEAIRILDAIKWLKNVFVPFTEKDIAYNLEGAIDGLAMNGAKGDTDYTSLGERINGFWDTCPVVPYWATRGGFEGNGRIPRRCREKNPIIAFDPISNSLAALQRAHNDLDDFVNGMQWLNLRPAPMAIETYPIPEEMWDVYDRTGELVRMGSLHKARLAWKKDNDALRSKHLSDKAHYKALREVCKKHFGYAMAHGEQWFLSFIAGQELLTRGWSYTGKRGLCCHTEPRRWGADHEDAGRPTPVFDGYLNNPEFFPMRRKLYEVNGLTRNLHFASLYGGKCEKFYGQVVDVRVNDGIIRKLDDDQIIGLDRAIPDGQHTLTYGVLYLEAPVVPGPSMSPVELLRKRVEALGMSLTVQPWSDGDRDCYCIWVGKEKHGESPLVIFQDDLQNHLDNWADSEARLKAAQKDLFDELAAQPQVAASIEDSEIPMPEFEPAFEEEFYL